MYFLVLSIIIFQRTRLNILSFSEKNMHKLKDDAQKKKILFFPLK